MPQRHLCGRIRRAFPMTSGTDKHQEWSHSQVLLSTWTQQGPLSAAFLTRRLRITTAFCCLTVYTSRGYICDFCD